MENDFLSQQMNDPSIIRVSKREKELYQLQQLFPSVALIDLLLNHFKPEDQKHLVGFAAIFDNELTARKYGEISVIRMVTLDNIDG